MSPSFSSDTGQVVSLSGLDLASSAAKTAGAARNANVRTAVVRCLNVFIMVSVTPIIRQSRGFPSNIFLPELRSCFDRDGMNHARRRCGITGDSVDFVNAGSGDRK